MKLERELATAGIRVNKQKPNIYFKVGFRPPASLSHVTSTVVTGVVPPSWKPNLTVVQPKSGGGCSINSTVKLTKLSDKLIHSVLHDFKIHNCEVSTQPRVGNSHLSHSSLSKKMRLSV